jgi:hypothetical protein
MSSVITLSAMVDDSGVVKIASTPPLQLHRYQIENCLLLGYYAASSGNFLPILAAS